MMKRLSLLLILGIIAISLLLPLNVPAQAEDNLTIGTKVVLDNNVVATYLGKTPEGKHLWQAVVGAPQYLDDLQTPIEAKWIYDSEKKQWDTGANLFNATAKDAKVTVWYEGKKLSWQPDVFIGTKKQAVGIEQLINNDTLNEYYFSNTLQWNYGNITRSIRITEGILQEYYTIDEMPGGDIAIISHSEKDAGFIWTRPAIAWDSNGRLLNLIVDGDDLTLTVEAMEGATFPIIIDPDTTFVSEDEDNTLANSETDNEGAQKDWDDCREDYRASGTGFGVFGNVAVAGKYTGGQWYAACHRIVLYFDTSSLPNDCNVTNATLRLYGTGVLQNEMGVWHMVIQDGTPTYPHDPLVDTDFNFTKYSGNGGNISSDNMGTGYKELYFSPDGVSWINVAGTTKFILREEEHDINDTLISYGTNEYDANEWEFYFYEQGDGYRPELVVYYEASALPAITTNAATYVTATTARLNSYLNDDGGEACDARFQYSTVSGGSGGDLENFSNYTEVDPNAHITATNATHVDFDAWGNEAAYLYDDKGAAHFDDFEHLIDVQVNQSSGHGIPWMLANNVNDAIELHNASQPHIRIHLIGQGSGAKIQIYEDTGSLYYDTYTGLANTWYYLNPKVEELNFTCEIYDDAARTNLTDTLTLTLHTDYTFQYIYAANTWDYGTATALDVDIENLNLQEGGEWTSTAWVNDAYRQGDSPYANIANLNTSTQYFFRAQARNTQGIVNGSELNFTTGTMSAPTNLTTYPDSHSISLSWIKGDGTYNTMIRYQVGAYPTNYTDGEQAYFGTMSTAVHSNLTPGTTYYYRAFGEGGGNYTANYTSAMTTTYAGAGAGDVPDAPTTPFGWFGTPDYTNMENFPLYDMVNDIADDFGVPRNTFWLFGALLVVAIIGMFIYRHTHSGIGAMIASGVLIVVFSTAFGVPLWIIAPVIVVAAGGFIALRRV